MEAQSCPSPTPAGLDADACWKAVLDRDVRADGVFFYGVRSTKIYCRPSCPSRRPGRDRVLFFATAEDAGRGGFRPCLRCRPDEAEPRADLVRRACRLIESRPEETISLKALGEAVGLSPSHLARTFKATLGVTPREYADACRLGRLKAGLKRRGTVAGAMYEAGYGSSSRLYERTDPQLGMTPTAYRKGGSGQSIRYTIADSPLGRLLVAATDRGLCAVILGDDDRALEEWFRKEYPAARRERDEAGLGQWVDILVQHLDGGPPHRDLDLPLDVKATAFQRLVWAELRAIPYGTTRSYGEIAEALGLPGAARAVARACASNRVALVIPCHRVVRGDGDISGYRWGKERKRVLLDLESRRRRES